MNYSYIVENQDKQKPKFIPPPTIKKSSLKGVLSMECDSYITYYDDSGNRIGQGYCFATKECEPCNCSGDKTKCNFYDYIRKQGLVEIGVSECTTVETLINVLKQYPKDMEVKVVIDRKVRPLAEVVLGFDLEKNKDCVWIVGKSNEM